MERERQILEAARRGAEAALPAQMQLLEVFSGIDCGTGNREGNRKVAELVTGCLKTLGAAVEWKEDPDLGIHVIGRIRPERPAGKVILAAHLDTVFGEGFVKKHPFRLDGDWAYGLGISDCKSGVVIALGAVGILERSGLLPDWEITFLFNCDEEIGSPSGSRWMEREAADADCAFVLEGGREKDGVMRLITARRGVILGSIDVTGREAHAGKDYRNGRSAVKELAHKILDLYDCNDEEKKIYYNVAPISGGRPNGVVAGEAHAEFCCAGLPANRDFAAERRKIHGLAETSYTDGCVTVVEEHTLFPAMERSEKNHLAYLRLERAAKALGIPVEEAEDPSATDACYYSSFGVPCVDALSAIGAEIHTVKEHVFIPSIRRRTEFLAVALGLMKGKET